MLAFALTQRSGSFFPKATQDVTACSDLQRFLHAASRAPQESVPEGVAGFVPVAGVPPLPVWLPDPVEFPPVGGVDDDESPPHAAPVSFGVASSEQVKVVPATHACVPHAISVAHTVDRNGAADGFLARA
jgi:hypothetical protein